MSYFLSPNPNESWTSSSTSFASRLVVNGASVAGGEVLLQPADHTNSAGSIQFRQLAASGRYNWLIGADINTNNAFDICSSTDVDGNAFTNVMLRVTGAGSIALGRSGGTLGFFGVSPTTRAAAYTPTNVSVDRSYDADSLTVEELADVVGTLISDLQGYGLLQ